MPASTAKQRRALLAFVACLLCLPGYAELNLILTLEGAAGHDANRYQTPLEEGASFLSISPELGLVWFASDTTEVNADVAYRRQEFTQSEFAYRDTIVGHFSAQRFWNRIDGILSIETGVYRDGAIPIDDQSWVSVAPGLRFTDWEARQVYVHGLVSYGEYDSRLTTTGAAQDGTRGEIRPGIALPLSITSSLWLEGYVETYSGNENAEEYDGVGLAVGSMLWPRPALHMRLLAQYGMRSFPNDYLDIIVSREDEPLFIDGDISYRFVSWAEVFLAGRWTSYKSSESGLGYDAWTAQAGIRITEEFAVETRID